ncbi:MAG: hypothetical protein VKK03_02980 [Synechococcus sp.]|nr:hypothetical protein [Synechococcus sp.]
MNSVTSILARSPNTSEAAVSQRRSFFDAAERFYADARKAAEEGNIDLAATLILRALDQERRAGGVGPQVMQIIKPRS